MTSSNPVVRPTPRISPRLAHALNLENTIHLNARPEAHGPFPGMISDAPIRPEDKPEYVYEVGHTDGSHHKIIADTVQTDDFFVALYRKDELVSLLPIDRLTYLGRLLEQPTIDK